jgi:hypothetical protein
MDYFNLIREKRGELSSLESELRKKKESLHKEIDELKAKHLTQLKEQNSTYASLVNKYLIDVSKNMYKQEVPVYNYSRKGMTAKYRTQYVKIIPYFNEVTSKTVFLDYVSHQYAILSWGDNYVLKTEFKQIEIDKIDGNSIQKIKSQIFSNNVSSSIKIKELEDPFTRIKKMLEFNVPSITPEVQKDLIIYELTPYLSKMSKIAKLSKEYGI